jgi:hypothetical protein
MRFCNLFCNPLSALNLGTRFLLRGEGCTFLSLNPYKYALIMFVIQGFESIWHEFN